MKKTYLLIIFLATNIFFCSGEDSGKTVFATSLLSDNDLYLSLEGSWTFDLTTFANGTPSDIFKNLSFKQKPDLSASIWLFNKFFFETNIISNSDENIFLLGYQNSGEGGLKEFRIGNDDLNISEYAHYTPPINKNRSPGIRAKIENSNSTHEILGIYSKEDRNLVTYRGFQNVDTDTLDITNYTTGYFFVLPIEVNDFNLIYSNDSSELLTVEKNNFNYYKNKHLLYVENTDFNKIYIDVNEFEQSELTTILYNFIDPDNNPGIVTTLTATEIWDKYIKIIDGKNYLSIFSVGEFSPFEHLGVYTSDNFDPNSNYEIFLEDTKLINYRESNGFIILDDPTYNYLDLNYRYPLIQLDPYIYSAQGQGLNSNISIYIKTFTTVDSITVPLTVKENSLTVNINGVKYTDFTHDTDSGKISFKKQITPLDDIVIYYKEDSSIGNGNLLLSYGSKYNINENLSLELSNTGNWNLSKEEYTYSTNENIGNLSSKVEVNYKNSYLSGRLTSESVISTPDTLGKYLLFSYSTSNLIIPLLSTEIGISDSQLDLIKRIDNDIFLETSDIQKLAPDDSGGAYYINHVIGNSVFDVIVLESDEIGSGLSASLNLNLKDYKDNYSWATKFNINLLSSLSDRDITIKFINPDLPDNNVLSKAIRVNKSDTYQEYTVDFTEEERAKLKYISNIVIQLNEGSKSLILLKSISFTGDSLVKHQGSNSYTVSSLSEDMIIKTTGTTDGKDIEIGSKISPIDITQYKKLNMTITNSGLFKGDTSFNLNLKNRGEVVASITIPGSYIEIGNNRIEVDLDNKTINNNNNTIGTFDITGSGIVDSISYNISNYEISSELRLSPIVLSEPVTDFYNQSGIKLEYTPNLSLTWKDREILSNFVLTTSNYFNYSDRNSYLLSADIRFTLLEKDVKAGIIFDDTIKELNYFVSLPTLQLPLSISDSFIYSSNSYRNSKLNLDTKYLDLRIDLEDTTGSESGKRVSQFELELKNEESYLLIIDSQLTQLRNDSIDILNSEIGQSYYKIIPKNTLDLSNNLNSSLSFLLKKSIFEINSLQSTSYKQVKYPDNIGSNNYYGDISITLDLKDIKLKPKISTDYSFLESSSINNLEEGVKNHLSKFLEYNPYKELSFSDIFYSGNGLDFYYNDDLFLNKKLNSLLSLEIENNIETSINLFIPNNITYSLNKTYTDDATREETNIINSLDLGFTSSRSLKNSFTANNSYNIENKSNTFSFQWKLIYYKELFKDYILDITNDLMLKENSFSTLLKTNFNWPGKSGPLLITPLFDKVLDKPYNYKHEEALYLNFDQLDSKFGVGFRHETVLNVKDINKTSFYIDVGYKNYSTVKLSLELGIYTTIIF